MLRLPGRIERNAHLREFSKADRQVDVRKRIVRQPAAAVACGIHPVHAAAIVKPSVEAARTRRMRRDTDIAASTELRRCDTGDKERRRREGCSWKRHLREFTAACQAG